MCLYFGVFAGGVAYFGVWLAFQAYFATMLDICWRRVTERVLLGLWVVNQAEESVLPAARWVLRRMVGPAKALSAIGAPIAGLPIALAGRIFPERPS